MTKQNRIIKNVITGQTSNEFYRQYGSGPHQRFDMRAIGRSTAIILNLISEAISKPNTPIKVTDHYTHPECGYTPHYLLKENLHKAQSFVGMMGLRGFIFNGVELTIAFSPFEVVVGDE